jgi:predicted TIM-barrel fold metal-dependent hydrolase
MSPVPVAGVDCHAHIIDSARFPYVDGAGYRPRAHEQGTSGSYAEVLRNHGVTHAVLVQPSCYAFDNRAMLDAMARSEGRWKGIAVVPDNVDETTLGHLSRRGVVGARLNLGTFDPGFFERPAARTWLARMRDRGWLVQVYARSVDWPRIAPGLLDSGVIVVIDHLGHPDLREPIEQPGFQAVLELGRRGLAYVKLAAPYRLSQVDPPHGDLMPFVRAAIESFGLDRCVFGSDWPFLNTSPKPTYAEQLAWLTDAVPQAPDRHRILVANPVRLYGLGANALVSASGEA